MMDVKITTKKETRVIETTVHEVQLNDLFTMTLTVTKTNDKPATNLSVAGNFDNGKYIMPCLLDDELLKVFTTVGYPHLFGARTKELQVLEKKFETINKNKKEVFWAIAKGNSPYTSILVRNYDHSFYDLKQQKNFRLKHFDYIDGNIDNENFDLNRLQAHLKASTDPNLSNVTGIVSIPYYNASPRRNKYFTFNYLAEAPFEYDSWTLKAHVLSNIGVNEFRIPLKEDDDDNSDID